MGAALPLALGGVEVFDFITIRVLLFCLSRHLPCFAETQRNSTATAKRSYGLGAFVGSEKNAGTSLVMGGGATESF